MNFQSYLTLANWPLYFLLLLQELQTMTITFKIKQRATNVTCIFCRELNIWFDYFWKFVIDPKIDLLVSYFKLSEPTSPVSALLTAIKSITLPRAYRYQPTIDYLLEVHKRYKN